MAKAPIGWKVTHVRNAAGRWGTDVEFSTTGRVIKIAGKLTVARAVAFATKYLRDEEMLAAASVVDVPEPVANPRPFVFPAAAIGRGAREVSPVEVMVTQIDRAFPDLSDADWEEIENCGLSDELMARIKPQTEPFLADEDWLEIYTAVEEKHARLNGGFYGRDRAAKDWQAHMSEILKVLEPIKAQHAASGKALDFVPLTDIAPVIVLNEKCQKARNGVTFTAPHVGPTLRAQLIAAGHSVPEVDVETDEHMDLVEAI